MTDDKFACISKAHRDDVCKICNIQYFSFLYKFNLQKSFLFHSFFIYPLYVSFRVIHFQIVSFTFIITIRIIIISFNILLEVTNYERS